ncbi:hypothetical protein Tco_0336679 [Tanacetum coccineum]
MYNWIIANYGTPNANWIDSLFDIIANDVYTIFFDQPEHGKDVQESLKINVQESSKIDVPPTMVVETDKGQKQHYIRDFVDTNGHKSVLKLCSSELEFQVLMNLTHIHQVLITLMNLTQLHQVLWRRLFLIKAHQRICKKWYEDEKDEEEDEKDEEEDETDDEEEEL